MGKKELQSKQGKEQCKYCITTIEKVRMARHVCAHHKNKVEEWIKEG